MVIAKPQWFVRRKYGGWGLMPKTWQGWIYSLIMIIIVLGLVNAPLDMKYKIVIILAAAIFFFIDIGSAMIRLKDEREKIHEAVAERNALWAVLLVLVIGISYQAAESAVKGNYSSMDWFLVAAVFVALVVKAVSNIWLDRKD